MHPHFGYPIKLKQKRDTFHNNQQTLMDGTSLDFQFCWISALVFFLLPNVAYAVGKTSGDITGYL